MKPRLHLVKVFAPCLLAVALFLGCGRGKPPEKETTAQATPVPVEPAVRGALDDTLVLTGTAEAENDTTVEASVPGNVAAVYVRVGDRVRAGQALVRLDTDLAAAQAAQSASLVRSAEARRSQAQVSARLTDQSTRVGIRQAEIAVRSAQEQLSKARAAYELTKSSVESGIESARTALETAEAQLRDIRAGAREQEIAQAQAALDQAEAALRLAQSDYRRAQNLYEAKAVSAQMLENAKTNYEVAESRAQQAREALSLAKAGARGEQVRIAELAVQQARQQLQLAESRRDQIVVAQRDVNAAEQALTAAEQQLQLARAQRQQLEMQQAEIRAATAALGQARAGERYSRTALAKHYVRAPFAGVVAARLVEPGQNASGGGGLIRLVDLQPMKVKAQVSELQIGRLSVGKPARVTVDGLPGRTFAGRIVRISPAANSGQRTYTAEVKVDNRQELIKPGMFCRVHVLLATVTDAIVIPRDALVESGEQRLVYLVKDGKVEVREVTVGAQSDSKVQALSGVEEGDLLIISGQTLLAKGQRVTAKEKGKGTVVAPMPEAAGGPGPLPAAAP